MWNYGPNMDATPFMWMGMAIGFIVLLIFLGLLVWMIIAMNRKNNTDSPSPSSSRAVELLKERYARGEIDSEEFRERLAELDEKKRI